MFERVLPQLGKFAISTILSAGLTVLLPIILHERIGIPAGGAVAISQSTALAINFLMIRSFVFRSKRAARRDLPYYVGSALAFRSLEYLCFLGLFGLGHLYYVVALLLTLVSSTVLKFFWYRFLFDRNRGEVA